MSDNDTLLHLADAYYRTTWQRWPSRGSRVGLCEYDAMLEVPDEDLYGEQLDFARATLRRLEQVPRPGPGSDAWLDYQTFEAHLKLEELWLGSLELWRRNPAEPLEEAVAAIFHLLMRRDLKDSDVAEAIVARLERVPLYLEAGRSRIGEPARLWVEAAMTAANGAHELLQSAADTVTEAHPRLQSAAARAVERARDAVRGYMDWLGRLADGPLVENPAIGESNLLQIVRLGHGLSWTTADLERFAEQQIAYWEELLETAAARIDPSRSWQQQLADARERFARQQHDLVAEYRRVTAWLRGVLEEKGVVDLPPNERCDVIETPAFLKPFIPTAAYSAPGPFEQPQLGIFYVSVPDPALDPDEYRVNVGQHFGLEATCVHEAYPGHHVQLCWANQVQSMIRRLAHHIVFIEGWTLYCEQLVQELGLFEDPLMELEYLHAQLWRAYRVLIDTSVQTGRMTVTDAIQLLVDRLGFSHLRARTELTWYTQSPGTPMSYMLGKHQTLALREQYRRRHPEGALRKFHRWLLSFGSIPQRWIAETLAQQG